MTNFGVYTLSISDHYYIYAIRKIGSPRGNPKIIRSRNFEYFDESAFTSDLKMLNGFSSELGSISCGVPQGTILGPLLFLIYINDLPNCLQHCTARLYADDSSLNTSGTQLNVIEPLMNADLKHVSSWLIANKLTLNVIKTVYMVVGSRQRLVYSLRNSTFNFIIPNARTEPYRNSFAFTGAKI